MSTFKQIPVLSNTVVSETKKHFQIKTDVKGYSAENIDITAWGDSIIVEFRSRHEPGQSYYLGELEEEYHKRIVPLGFNVSSHDVHSDIQAGELTILVNKQEPEQTSKSVSARAVA